MLKYDLSFYSTSLTQKGSRIALRAKVNDTLLTGISLVDNILPIGRGQRQLINSLVCKHLAITPAGPNLFSLFTFDHSNHLYAVQLGLMLNFRVIVVEKETHVRAMLVGDQLVYVLLVPLDEQGVRRVNRIEGHLTFVNGQKHFITHSGSGTKTMFDLGERSYVTTLSRKLDGSVRTIPFSSTVLLAMVGLITDRERREAFREITGVLD